MNAAVRTIATFVAVLNFADFGAEFAFARAIGAVSLFADSVDSSPKAPLALAGENVGESETPQINSPHIAGHARVARGDWPARERAMRASWVQNWMMRIGGSSLLRHRPLLATLVATCLVALAVVIRLTAGNLLEGAPFLTLFSAIALSAFVGGWMVGLLATVLGGVLTAFFVFPTIGMSPIWTGSVVALAGYIVTCVAIVLIIHVAIRAAEANVTLATQRQILLMELQHRIKNHLQLLGAMIATHARATTNDKIRTRLEEAGRRLHVIAAIYDNLYEPGALIDMADHLQRVCAFVEGGVASRGTRIHVDAVHTAWSVERVIPLSLVANDLLTNAVKHAPSNQELTIEVSLQRVGGLMQFSVLTKDVKLQSDFDAASSGLGLKIASMLGKQLGGSLMTPLGYPRRCSYSSFQSSREGTLRLRTSGPLRCSGSGRLRG